MKLVSGIVDSGFFAQSALSAEVATKDSLGRNISETYLTGVDLTPYQTTAGMTAYQEAGDYYSASNPSGFISEVPAGTMNESAFGYDANDKISGYNGSAFAGGSDVPEGVMVESGLEFNAVNEISGYNGSAIAQYGAEKQWLVHDDTLVHASNSAQYALGVNLSAVAQLLGVDETVLWENTETTAVTSMTLSEDVRNFDRFRVYWLWNNGTDFVSRVDEFSNFYTGTSHRAFSLDGLYRYNGVSFTVYSRFLLDTDYSSITYEYTNQNNDTTHKYIVINKIIGIGRKS